MNKLSLLLAVATCSTLPLGAMQAQSPSPSPTATPAATPATTPAADTGKVHKKGGGDHGAAVKALPAEDQEKLKKAREAAMADPAVQAAKASGDKHAYGKALRETMLRNDPSLAPVLDKVRTNLREERQNGTLTPAAPGATTNPGKEKGKPLAFLPADERVKVVTASRTAQTDPKVSALRQQWTSAATPAAKADAGKAYRTALRDTMLRNDPSLAPILQKVQEHRQAQAEDLAF